MMMQLSSGENKKSNNISNMKISEMKSENEIPLSELAENAHINTV